jgi:hypothetical protein
MSRYTLEREDGVLSTGFLGLRIGRSGKLLWMHQWTFRFHKMLEVLEWLYSWWPLE